ncbi:hypothetical protein CsSME_00043581 [Camellia sinensis var. sinensis]
MEINKKKTLEYRELIETVFIGASATGKNHWTPGEKVVESAAVSSDSVDSIGLRPFVDLIPACATDVNPNSSIELIDTTVRRKRTPLTSCANSKKEARGASIIAENMNNLTNMIRMHAMTQIHSFPSWYVDIPLCIDTDGQRRLLGGNDVPAQ